MGILEKKRNKEGKTWLQEESHRDNRGSNVASGGQVG